MRPYYSDESVTLYHGDCREILPTIPGVDLVLTDPPYGVGFGYESYDDNLTAWRGLMDFLIPWIRSRAVMGILPACQIGQLDWIYANHKPDWLICWYKGSPGHRSYIGFNDWEPLLVYGKPKGLSMHDYIQVRPESPRPNGHPCPKPLEWAARLIARTTQGSSLVLDPFAGSGTTLKAAKNLGRMAIGVELSERYCEQAADWLSQNVLDLGDVA